MNITPFLIHVLFGILQLCPMLSFRINDLAALHDIAVGGHVVSTALVEAIAACLTPIALKEQAPTCVAER